MKYGHIEQIQPPVSRLVQGTMMLTMEDLDGSLRLLDDVYAAGCSAFDAAHVYGGGDCERILGQWMHERGVRDKVAVIDKGGHHNQDRRRITSFDITADIYDSLARLQTDYIDIYMLHRDDPEVPASSIIDILNDHFREGRIRMFGASNWTCDRIREANAYAAAYGLEPFRAVSPHFSLAEQVQEPWEGCVSLAGRANAGARIWYRVHNIPVFAWSSLCHGFFSGLHTPETIAEFPDDTDELFVRCYRSPANLERLRRAQHMAHQKGITLPQLVLAWCFHQPLDLYALVGCISGAEYRENTRAFDVTLTPEEIAELESA